MTDANVVLPGTGGVKPAEFRAALEWHLEQHGTKIADIVAETGVSRDVIKKLRTRPNSSTTVENGVLIAGYYGKTLDQFLRLQDVPRAPHAAGDASDPPAPPAQAPFPPGPTDAPTGDPARLPGSKRPADLREPGYAGPVAGLPPQTGLTTDTAVFTQAYAVIPRTVMRDIVTSFLPGWTGMRMWVLARPLSGFAETFSQYVVELAPDGGSDRPDDDPEIQHAIFVTGGELRITIAGTSHLLTPGGFAYVPPGTDWAVSNQGDGNCGFHWIRKRWQPVAGLDRPDPVIAQEREVPPSPMPETEGAWSTTRFVDPADLRHDMHVTIVTFTPGGSIPFAETHVMEHGLFVLEGKAVYRLNRDWVEVGPGDFMWLRAFCPQACYAGGPGRFRYLLYKDVNRHAPLWPVRG